MRQYFNPRSPHGERPAHQSEDDDKPHISIHAPAWGATGSHAVDCIIICISIHAPRMGSAKTVQIKSYLSTYFNPRSPHGERPSIFFSVFTACKFQSTLPAWGATRQPKKARGSQNHFNPRSPHGERLCRR